MSNKSLITNISKIAGAMYYYYIDNVYELLLLWLETGELYAIKPHSEHFRQAYKIQVTNQANKIKAAKIQATSASLSPNPFVYLYHGIVDIKQYNAILTRIEDIYGMSIDEFSLGKLEYIDSKQDIIIIG